MIIGSLKQKIEETELPGDIQFPPQMKDIINVEMIFEKRVDTLLREKINGVVEEQLFEPLEKQFNEIINI